MTTLLFCEKPALRAVFGTAGTAAKGTVSGDAVQQFCSPAAAQMILCDGMGTGRPAAVDGSPCRRTHCRLLKAGFTAELAARLVNVALALKSDEESGATLDLISVGSLHRHGTDLQGRGRPGLSGARGPRPSGGRYQPAHRHSGRRERPEPGGASRRRGLCRTGLGRSADGRPRLGGQAAGTLRRRGDPPEKVARILVETARARAEQTGRPDDITAAVLRLEPCGH